MSTYRTGGHWQRTIVRVGTQPPGHDGRRPDDQLVGMVDTPELAERICALLNREDSSDIVIAYPRTEGRGYPAVPDSCTCRGKPDPACPVHQGRRARGPKPSPVGPGCICDGSGRICPRHGAVL